ncbi:MAG: transketolase [Alphaproteobacteria bacterium]
MSISHTDMANAIRFLAIDAVEKAQSGHPGMPMGMADVATVLFRDFLSFDPHSPDFPNRDRFVLSAGHGSMLLYALLYLTGYEKMTLEQLQNFRQLGSHTPGHPEADIAMGIETTTGPLGQGIANAVGMALAERMIAAEFPELVEHYTYVIASDGDLMEGISHEACSLAGHLGLNRLIVLYDDNDICIDGPTSLSFSDDSLARFTAYGWNVARVDGHDETAIKAAIAAAIAAAQQSDKPNLISCKTIIGKGSPNKQGKSSSHGSPLGKDEVAATRAFYQWNHEPFVIPADILAAWRAVGTKGAVISSQWQEKFAQMPETVKAAWQARHAQVFSAQTEAAFAKIKQEFQEKAATLATRTASGAVLEAISPTLPMLVGGSADLTPSNNTKTKERQVINRQNYLGHYVHYGVREHGMAAMMNGMALYGGIIPYSGTFLSFADYCRPSIRLSALMKTRVIYVMTHDSIGLGEDGPTHQPVEHLASLRAIPDLLVLRPADAVEVAECWEIALQHQGPSVLVLTRQNLPLQRTKPITENRSAKGGYIILRTGDQPQLILAATGSEIEIAVNAAKALEGIAVHVVSIPSWELLRAQGAAYKQAILPSGIPVIGIEAACGFGWAEITGLQGVFVGMKGFGASAPYQQLYQHFGITSQKVVEIAHKLLKK